MPLEYCYIPQIEKSEDGKTLYKDLKGNGPDIVADTPAEFTEAFKAILFKN